MPNNKIKIKPWLAGIAIVTLLLLVLVIAQQRGMGLLGANVPGLNEHVDEMMAENMDPQECNECIDKAARDREACRMDAWESYHMCKMAADEKASEAAQDFAEEMGIDDPGGNELIDSEVINSEVYDRESEKCDIEREIYSAYCDALPGWRWCYVNYPACWPWNGLNIGL